jgi:hypothetical protein
VRAASKLIPRRNASGTLRRRLIGAGVSLGLLAAALSSIPAANAAGSNLFATVDQNGNLIDGGGVSSVTHIGTGQYEVTFSTDVSSCAYVASTQNASSQALLITTAGGHLSSDGVYVETKNQGGGLTDGPFNLAVDCGTSGMQYAVVGYTANLVRATPGTTLTNLGAGRYDVKFPQSVAKCAYLATVGDPGNGLVFNPNVVASGSGPGSNTVYIETKNLGGGLSSGIPFHLAVICPSAPSTEVAVVAQNGIIARGSSLTSSYSSGTGTFDVVTNRNAASSCATIATRGSIDRNVPFDPATVETVPGPAANTFGVQTRGLLFFGGALASEAFHSAAIC